MQSFLHAFAPLCGECYPLNSRCCAAINTKLTLTDQTYVCERCGLVEDRDLNAVENLNRAGLARIYACGHDGPASVPRDIEASGMDETGS